VKSLAYRQVVAYQSGCCAEAWCLGGGLSRRRWCCRRTKSWADCHVRWRARCGTRFNATSPVLPMCGLSFTTGTWRGSLAPSWQPSPATD